MSREPENLRKEVISAIRQQEKSRLRQNTTLGIVTVNITPASNPIKSIDIEKFYSTLVEQFGAKFDDSELSKIIPNNNDYSPLDLIELSIRNDITLTFKEGVLSLEGLQKITAINNIQIGEQSLTASVSGSTDEALFLLKSVWLLLWSSCGINRNWKELEEHIKRINYRTTTEVEFTSNISQFINQSFWKKINHIFNEESNIGKRIGYVPYYSNELSIHEKETYLVPYCESVNFKLVKLNKTTGEADENDITIDVHQRNMANKKFLRFTTEMSANDHIELIELFSELLVE